MLKSYITHNKINSHKREYYLPSIIHPLGTLSNREMNSEMDFSNNEAIVNEHERIVFNMDCPRDDCPVLLKPSKIIEAALLMAVK